MPNSKLPTTEITEQSLYTLIGGEAGTLKLVNVFYDIIETDAIGHQLHLLHLRGNGLAHARVEQFNFLSGFLGGPKLYVEKHGHSNIRTLHEHLEINNEAKHIWLKCMQMAIEKIGLHTTTKMQLMHNFSAMAERLVNHSD